MQSLVSYGLLVLSYSLGALLLSLACLLILVSSHYKSKVSRNAQKLGSLPWVGLRPEAFSPCVPVFAIGTLGSSIHLKATDKSEDRIDQDPVVIASRLLMLTAEFTATKLTAALSLVLKRLASDPTYIYVPLQKLETKITEHSGRWDLRLLYSLLHLDSIFGESMSYFKFNGFGIALMRIVTATEGMKLPGDDSIIVPQGTWFGAPADVVHLTMITSRIRKNSSCGASWKRIPKFEWQGT